MPKIPAVTSPGARWSDRKNVSASRHSGLCPLVSSGAAAGFVTAGQLSPSVAPCTAKALPGMPETSPYAPVAIATWFGFVSATMIERDSR